MKIQNKNVSDSSTLRRKAEKLIENESLETESYLIDTEPIRLVHELQVYQIQLELQNEELRRAKDEGNVATQKYSELYSFAPSGFFTLSKEGMIVELNLCGANMPGKQRSVLINSIFITLSIILSALSQMETLQFILRKLFSTIGTTVKNFIN